MTADTSTVRRPAGRVRLDSLTGLRALAAFLVFGFHTFAAGIFGSHAINTLMSHSLSEGVVGVTFFFILSGFVLTWSSRPGDTVTGFWRRRAAKIVPNHVVTWVVAFAFLSLTGLTLTGSFTKFGTDSLPSLFLIQSWFPRGGVFFSMNIPAWSLACEAFFYFMFPLLIVPVRRLSARWLWVVAGALITAVWFMPVIADSAFHDGTLVPTLPVTQDRMWFVYTLPPVRMLEFVLGMVLALIVKSGRWPRVPMGIIALLALGAYIGSSWLPYLFGLSAGAVIPLALLIPAAAAGDAAGRRSVWSSRPLVWLGNVSFGFYMCHQLVIRWVHYGFGATRSFGTGPAIGITVLNLAVALLCATFLYYVVEMPMLRLLTGSRRTPAAQAPPAAAATRPIRTSALPAAVTTRDGVAAVDGADRSGVSAQP